MLAALSRFHGSFLLHHLGSDVCLFFLGGSLELAVPDDVEEVEDERLREEGGGREEDEARSPAVGHPPITEWTTAPFAPSSLTLTPMTPARMTDSAAE